MGRTARQQGHGAGQRGAVISALILLLSVVAAATAADQSWTPGTVAAAGVLVGLLVGLWGGERLVVRR